MKRIVSSKKASRWLPVVEINRPVISLLSSGSRGIWLAIISAVFAVSLAAQNLPADRLAYDAALRDFNTELWDRAVREFTEFEAKFTKSPLRAEAIQRRQFAQAEATSGRGDPGAAADLFAQFQRGFPQSPLAALAAVREATTRLNMGNARAAVEVLSATNTPLARAMAGGQQVRLGFRALLLKGEALAAVKDYPAAVSALALAAKNTRQVSEEWDRLRLLMSVEESAGALELASAAAVKMQALASNELSLSPRRAESAAVSGRIWLRRGEMAKAEAAFQANAITGAPMEYYREAILRLAELNLGRGETAKARARLEAFLTLQSTDPEINRVRLLLGQTLFRQYGEARGGTNAGEAASLLVLAGAQFQLALTNSAAAELMGPLWLGRGWTLWEEGINANVTDRVREAETNFLNAAMTLPRGSEQAVARFKSADCRFWLGDAAGSLTNYLAVLDGYPDVDVKELIEPAARQAVLAATQTGNRMTAELALARLLAATSGGASSARSTLLVGQSLGKAGDLAQARELLSNYLNRFPESPQKADVELMLISTDLRSRNWTNALERLGTWIGANPNHAQLPRAEFDRAWAMAQAGTSSNAMTEFALLAAKFPTNSLAATARLWLADNYFRSGDYTSAEQACLGLVTNTVWTGTEPWQRARFWAAEAARKRQSYSSASQQLLAILNDKSTPTNWVAAAFFALGELRLEQPPTDPLKPLEGVSAAREAFAAAAQFTNAPLVASALGKMADCNLQLAGQNSTNFFLAAELYQRVLDYPGTELALRCKAVRGLGLVQEKLALRPGADVTTLLAAATDHYLDIAHGKLCRPGEVMDPWWIRESGREAGKLLESLGSWMKAAAIYEWLAQELPAQATVWRERAVQARRQGGG